MRKYLSDLIRVNVHQTVNEIGSWERSLNGYLISLIPEQFNGNHTLQLFVNRMRQPKCWQLSSQPHKGWLQRNGYIPKDHNEIWYVVGSDGKRYRFLFIDGTHIGTRFEHFKNHRQMYRQKDVKIDGGLHDQAKIMEKELFKPSKTDEWEQFHRETELRYRLKGIS